jgi:hypothetical protein
MTFNTYYWHGHEFVDEELQRAWRILSEGNGRESIAAFERLLRSPDPIATCVALDYYDYADASERHGAANPFHAYRNEVRIRARNILRDAPSEKSGTIESGANHASALGALLNLAEVQDSDAVASALEKATTSNVRFVGANVAGKVLQQAPHDADRLMRILERIALDSEAGDDERNAAVRAIAVAPPLRAAEALLRVSATDDLGLQASAALALLDIDVEKHREYVQRLVDTWPADPPYPAQDVIEALTSAPEE